MIKFIKRVYSMIPWYVRVFENTSEAYDREPFVQGTISEVDWIESQLNFDKNSKILDVACGTGRHTIELAARGYEVVGVDISQSQIAAAKEKALFMGVQPTFLVKDGRELCFEDQFDAVLNICEGGFGLLEDDHQDFLLLKRASECLKPDGILIMTVLNALHRINQDSSSTTHFDSRSLRESFTIDGVDDDGLYASLACSQRYYAPSEIQFRLELLGFSEVQLLGCPQGDFSKAEAAVSSKDMEILAIAKSPRGRIHSGWVHQ